MLTLSGGLDPSHSEGFAAEFAAKDNTASDNEQSVHHMAEGSHQIESVDAHGLPIKDAWAPLFQNGALASQGVYGERTYVTIFSQLILIL